VKFAARAASPTRVERALDGPQQLGQRERLLDEIKGAEPGRFDCGLDRAVSGHHDHRTAVGRGSLDHSRSSVMPSVSGIQMSSSTRSGVSGARARHAPGCSVRPPRRPRSPPRSGSPAAVRRMSASSSTTRMRAGAHARSLPQLPHAAAPASRKLAPESWSLTGSNTSIFTRAPPSRAGCPPRSRPPCSSTIRLHDRQPETGTARLAASRTDRTRSPEYLLS
jgi:hypothetical protein